MEADPVFAKLPPGSRLTKPISDQAAYYDNAGITGGSAWQGPTVTEDFTTKFGATTLLSSVNAMAVTAGWVRYSTSGWTKEVALGKVYLTLNPVIPSGPNAYELTASA
ncbi:MAG: hypothetical protein ACRDY2_02715 [Acidimicrobiales bacterium]